MTPDFFDVAIRLNDAATTDEDYYATVNRLSGTTWYLEQATWTPMTSCTLDAAEKRVLTLSDGTNTLGTLDTSAVAWVAGTPAAMTLSGGKNREITAVTEAFKVASVHGGSTGRVADGILQLRFSKIAA